MNITEWKSFLGIEDVFELPARVMEIVMGDQAVRDDCFREAISRHGGDLSYDWFLEVYADELAKRKVEKQEFTPLEVATLVAGIVDTPGCCFVHEPTVGTGGLVISKWWRMASGCLPWDFRPSSCMVSCWELTDRALPLLLFNLSIRGIVGEVFHGDVLENKAKARYVLINEHDDALTFSQVIRDDSITGYQHRPMQHQAHRSIVQLSLFDKK